MIQILQNDKLKIPNIPSQIIDLDDVNTLKSPFNQIFPEKHKLFAHSDIHPVSEDNIKLFSSFNCEMFTKAFLGEQINEESKT